MGLALGQPVVGAGGMGPSLRPSNAVVTSICPAYGYATKLSASRRRLGPKSIVSQPSALPYPMTVVAVSRIGMRCHTESTQVCTARAGFSMKAITSPPPPPLAKPAARMRSEGVEPV
jgi:hypothetical protein